MKSAEATPAIHVDISGRRLARNTALNLVGRVVPLLVAILTVPYVIHHLGPDRYGLYSLAWIVVGYFALFNLGIGPATTKFVAEFLGKGETAKLPELVWTATASQAALGLAGGIVLAAASPWLVHRVLRIPAELHSQAHVIFLIMAALLPFDFAIGSMQGVLGASQRFDLLNAVSIPASTLSYLLPVGALALGFGLPAIVLILGLARVASLAVVTVLCLRLYPALRHIRFDFRLVRSLLSFGGWVTATTAIGPVLFYTDRLLIGALDSIAALGYYSVAYRVTLYLTYIPSALGGPLLPAFSSLKGAADTSRAASLFLKSYKYTFLAIVPVLLAMIMFAGNIFAFWIGEDFAAHVTAPFQMLAMGTMAALFGPLANALLQGHGRPDIVSKIYMFHLPVNTLVVWACVSRWGITGAALSAAVRNVLDASLLFYFSTRICGLKITKLFGRESFSTIMGVTLSLLLLGAGWAVSSEPFPIKVPIFAATLGAYVLVTLMLTLAPAERQSLQSAMLGVAFGRGRGSASLEDL